MVSGRGPRPVCLHEVFGMPIRKVLIANRGEIACRIIHTCNAMGLATVGVYSEADAGALHVALADEAIAIGPAPATQSYLAADAVLAAARASNADAVHPGYGFLAESAPFARAVADAGRVWIGPRPKTIEDMGDKERARDIACACAIPVLPGSARFTAGDCDGIGEAAQEVGFPLLVKAAAGGGGIGMRRVDALDTLAKEVANAQGLAARAFADDTVYLERYVARARHVEVQIFGFGDGAGVHLFERDCSVQRRYQKVIEEAPAPDLPRDVCLAMREAALALVHHQRYRGAGTVEFIYEPDRREFYFLEMNTRIQVEHAVTEMITGIDLVRWQIELAAGSLAAGAPGSHRGEWCGGRMPNLRRASGKALPAIAGRAQPLSGSRGSSGRAGRQRRTRGRLYHALLRSDARESNHPGSRSRSRHRTHAERPRRGRRRGRGEQH